MSQNDILAFETQLAAITSNIIINSTAYNNSKQINNKLEIKIAVAVSGGSDSVGLIIALKRIGYKNLLALIVNHNLRSSSHEEALYTAKLMDSYDIESVILHWDGKVKNNLEHEAREARYNLLSQTCKEHKINFLATGHHLNDQVETFLLNLARGSELDGLCAMPEILHRDNIYIIRPLLTFTKDAIQQYLISLNIKWIEDESNSNTDFKRNAIRSSLLKIEDAALLNQRIANSVNALQEIKEIIDEKIQTLINEMCVITDANQIIITLDAFLEQKKYIQKTILTKLIQHLKNSKYKVRSEDILEILDFARQKQQLAVLAKANCIITIVENQILLITS